MKRKAVASERGLTYIPTRGKGWVNIPTSDPDYFFDVDALFAGENDTDKVDIRLTNASEKSHREDQSHTIFNNNPINGNLLNEDDWDDYEDIEEPAVSPLSFRFLLDKLAMKDKLKSNHRRKKFLSNVTVEKKYWASVRPLITELYVNETNCGRNIAGCHSEKLSRYKCLQCKLCFCSVECFQDAHQDGERILHTLEEWSDNFGWVFLEMSLFVNCCDCKDRAHISVTAISLLGLQNYTFQSCQAHIIQTIISAGYFIGLWTDSRHKIIFETR